jgi:tetratricopeptide (TPR) repeat protein
MSKLLKITLFCLINLIFFKGLSQTKEETFLFAKSQYQLENYTDALKAFNRALFFEDAYPEEYYWYIGNCYFNLSELGKAEFYFDLSFSTSSNDSIKYSSVILKAQSMLMRQEYYYALYELLNIDETPYQTINHDRKLLTGITYFCMTDFDNSKKYFIDLADPSDEQTIAKINTIIEQCKLIKINPRKARILSTLMPGLGQFYIGEIKSGLNSMVLVSALGYLFVRTALAYTFIDAGLALMPWIQRYYMGGYAKAERLAYDKINNIKHQSLAEVIDLLTAVPSVN